MTEKKDEAKAPATVTTTDRDGHEFEVEVGADGKNPVSVNNPPAKAIAEDDIQVIKDDLKKVEERQAKIQSKGSDGPGNDHNADGIATDADRRDSVRPTTSAEKTQAEPSAKDQDANNKSGAKKA
jgi:hypothetical protein